MHIIESCLAQARRSCKRLVLPEGRDERIVRAALTFSIGAAVSAATVLLLALRPMPVAAHPSP